MSPLTTAFQHHTKISSKCNETRKVNKRDTNVGKKEINLSFFADDKVIYVETPNELIATKKPLTLPPKTLTSNYGNAIE